MSSYLVIARKWRPVVFDEMVGQAHVVRTLKNALSSGRVAHAYLFSGPRGVGKTTAARVLAKSLNCAAGPTPEPCNACASCAAIASGSSVDVLEIDGASNTSVENVRELRESVAYLPGQGRYRVYIIDEVHMLSGSAFNALLKTLEEPPPHAVFVFATTEAQKIPQTVLSRCQRFDFKRIPARDIQAHLRKIVEAESIGVAGDALYTLAREASGSLRDAQSLLDQTAAFAGQGAVITDEAVAEALGLLDRSVIYDLSEALAARDGKACLNIVEKIYDFGYDLKRASSDLLGHLRDLTVVKVAGDAALLDLPDNEIERLNAIAGRLSVERLQMLFMLLSRGYEDLLRSPTPRYSLEMALLKAAHCVEMQPLADLIRRLEGLKATIGGSGARSAAQPSSSGVPSGASSRAEEETDRGAWEAGDRAKAVAHGTTDPIKPVAERVKDADDEPAAGASTVDLNGLPGHIGRGIRSLAEPLKRAGVRLIDDSRVELTVEDGARKVFEMKLKQIEDLASAYLARRVKVTLKAAPTGDKANDPVLADAIAILGGRVIEERRRNNV
jgi:DNA polymerase-3 subunit gamma/tau